VKPYLSFLAAVLVVVAHDSAAQPAPPAPGTGIDWRLSPEQITSSCKAEISKARARIQALTALPARKLSVAEGLGALETAIADMNAALVAQRLLAHAAPDEAVREASSQCNEELAALGIEVSASPAVYALAKATQSQAKTQADKQLARLYVEAGRRSGAGLDPATRAKVAALFDQLKKLEIAYMRTLGEEQTTIEISAAEAASLPPPYVKTFTPTQGGYLVPVHFGSLEQFMKSQASGEARERFHMAFFNRGGQANVDRLVQALALRHRLARLLGFDSWAAYQLDSKMAKTPARALALGSQIGRKLLPKAREEVQVLARLKAERGDPTPFAAWDYPYYKEQFEQSRYGVSTEALRQYFPIDKVVPAVLDIYGRLLGVSFQPITAANTWAPGVLEFSITDTASGKPIGGFFLDLSPRPGKGLHFSNYDVRAGRVLPDGSWQPPISSIIGSGPASEPGKPALLSHHDAIILFHEFGHLMHATLSTAPYETLHGTRVRADFVEAPSQMLENWMWQPAVLKKISSHVTTGEPLPDELIQKTIALKHAADGVFWTRQAFLGVYDMTLHSSGPKVDATRLWRELTEKLTAVPPVPGTIPEASFAGLMGGYDAGYYGYLWSKVYSQDMFTAFLQGGLEDPKVGMRYRREILEPGGSVEPELLLRNFLGRPVSYDAFYTELGLKR
jgi:thimet oligopeptidase